MVILAVTIIRGRALAVTCTNQQITHGPLISRRKRNSEPRDHGRVLLGASRRTTPCVFNPRSRVCDVSLLATGQRNTRVLLTVADNRKSATARGWHGKMAMLLRFVPFRVELGAQLSYIGMSMTRNGANRKTVGRSKLWAPISRQHSRTVSPKLKAGFRLLYVAKPTSQHPPSPKLCGQNR